MAGDRPNVPTDVTPTAIKNDRCMFPQAPGGRVRSLGWPRISSGAQSRLPEADESSSSASGIIRGFGGGIPEQEKLRIDSLVIYLQQ